MRRGCVGLPRSSMACTACDEESRVAEREASAAAAATPAIAICAPAASRASVRPTSLWLYVRPNAQVARARGMIATADAVSTIAVRRESDGRRAKASDDVVGIAAIDEGESGLSPERVTARRGRTL